jgi:hypothetical protein
MPAGRGTCWARERGSHRSTGRVCGQVGRSTCYHPTTPSLSSAQQTLGDDGQTSCPLSRGLAESSGPAVCFPLVARRVNMPTRAEILDTLAAPQTEVLAVFQGLSPEDLERPGHGE